MNNAIASFRSGLQETLSGLQAHDREIHRQMDACHTLLSATDIPAAPAVVESPKRLEAKAETFVGKVRATSHRPMTQRVLESMAGGKCSMSDMTKLGNRKTVASAVFNLMKKKLIVRVGYGEYKLRKAAK